MNRVQRYISVPVYSCWCHTVIVFAQDAALLGKVLPSTDQLRPFLLMRYFLQSLLCAFVVGVAFSLAAPVAMSPVASASAPPGGELLQLPAPTFFRVWTQQHAALDNPTNQPANILSRLRWAHDRSQLQSIMYEYAAVQFNRRYDAVFDAVTLEMPTRNIFVRTARTRQRIATELARESEQANTMVRAWIHGKNADAAFLPALEQSIALYRQHLAVFTGKSVDWINEAAHKLH